MLFVERDYVIEEFSTNRSVEALHHRPDHGDAGSSGRSARRGVVFDEAPDLAWWEDVLSGKGGRVLQEAPCHRSRQRRQLDEVAHKLEGVLEK